MPLPEFELPHGSAAGFLPRAIFFFVRLMCWVTSKLNCDTVLQFPWLPPLKLFFKGVHGDFALFA